MIAYLDIIGAVFSFLSTICYIRVNLLAWPLGLVSIAIDIFLYWHKAIYGDVALHFIYLSLTIYGWYQWKFGSDQHKELAISYLTKKLAGTLTIVAIISYAIIYFLLHNYTNSQIPVMDALTTTLSLIAQWLICRKIIQCWMLWFIVDILYAGIYAFKGLPAHSFIQMIYLGMAIIGYLSWKKQFALDSVTVQP